MPILDDFKPDIIINSAGQDNHYSDPLTNMNFTAQGYAILNERLNPDIAVLEGGYSIEGALPYINVGIILAMAGLDYSHVREPDYDAERLKQDPSITAHIKQLSNVIYSIWKHKDELAKEAFKNKTKITREQNIYFDTARIMEHQIQTYTICEDCAGVDFIDSENDKNAHIFAITIPRKACQKCVEKAYKIYAQSSKESFTKIYLQDRVNDKYLSK